MPGDASDRLDGDRPGAGNPSRSRNGPRHAAPRKSLATRLQVPAGKAIALAAMPTAMLLGMGFTPRLAQADELPKNPFAPGPCVTQQDQAPEEQKGGTETTKPSPSASPSQSPDPDPTGSLPTGSLPTGSGPTGSGQADSLPAPDVPKPSTSAGPAEKAPSPLPSPSQSSGSAPEETGSGSILDPILDPIKDILGGIAGQDGSPAAEPSGSPSASPSSSPSASPSASATPTADAKAQAPEVPTPQNKDPVGDLAGQVTEKARLPDVDLPDVDLPDVKLPTPTDSEDEKAPDAADKAQTAPAADGKQPFPCPEEKKVAGEDEQTPNVLPDKPWTLKSSLLALHGLDFKGVVNVRTADGSSKQALKFTASAVDIGNLHQIVDGPGNLKYHVAAREGTTSTIRKGTVTMYTERLEGKLFGLIPIVFSPETPPPLNIPEVFFTGVTVTQAGQFGGELTVPGLHQFSTNG